MMKKKLLQTGILIKMNTGKPGNFKSLREVI